MLVQSSGAENAEITAYVFSLKGCRLLQADFIADYNFGFLVLTIAKQHFLFCANSNQECYVIKPQHCNPWI